MICDLWESCGVTYRVRKDLYVHKSNLLKSYVLSLMQFQNPPGLQRSGSAKQERMLSTDFSP